MIPCLGHGIIDGIFLLASYCVPMLSVKARIHRIKILRIQPVLRYAQSITKPLIVHDLTLAEVFERLANVGVIDETDEVVVGHARFLLCYYHVFATKLSLAKVRKILIFQGVSTLLKLTIFQKFQ